MRQRSLWRSLQPYRKSLIFNIESRLQSDRRGSMRISAMAATDFNLIADSVSLRRRTAFHRDRGHREGHPSDRADGSAGRYRDRGMEPALSTPAR
jgi:hypothetical protein